MIFLLAGWGPDFHVTGTFIQKVTNVYRLTVSYRPLRCKLTA